RAVGVAGQHLPQHQPPSQKGPGLLLALEAPAALPLLLRQQVAVALIQGRHPLQVDRPDMGLAGGQAEGAAIAPEALLELQAGAGPHRRAPMAEAGPAGAQARALWAWALMKS